MIKPVKSPEIRKNPQNFPKKNLKNLPASFPCLLGGNLPAPESGWYFSKKNFRGYFVYTPWPCLVWSISDILRDQAWPSSLIPRGSKWLMTHIYRFFQEVSGEVFSKRNFKNQFLFAKIFYNRGFLSKPPGHVWFGSLPERHIFCAYIMKTGKWDWADGSICSMVGSLVNRTQRPVSKLTALHVLFFWQMAMHSVRCKMPGIVIIELDGFVNTWPVSNSKVWTPSEQSIDQTNQSQFNFGL